ncbi:flagellin [Rubrivirga sp.]|uniref:flagellin N-terminal helical domain-containing protein n=1 Tax=Rubrivirga sp. TaxID=1885344 RepID=UPI003C7251A3
MTRPLQSALTRSASFTSTERPLAKARRALTTSQNQLATGYKIERASDDPTGFAQAKLLGRRQDTLARYDKVIGASELWVNETANELGALGEIFATASELGLLAANGIYSPEDIAVQIDDLRDEAVVRLRSNVQGEYLFAGNETDTAPIDEAGVPQLGTFTGARQREISPGQTVQINVVGALEVDGVSAVQRLEDLAVAIRAEDNLAIRTAVGFIQDGVDHYSRLEGQTGNTARQLEGARDALEAESIIVGDRRAQIEEIDLTEVFGDIQRRQVALEAALRATADSAQQSLLNYL